MYKFSKINDDITSIRRLKEMFPKINEEDFQKLIESDPTYNGDINETGKYGRWILSLYNKGNLKLEDLYKVKDYLTRFKQLKVKFNNKDINTYKTLPELIKAIEETESASPTKSEIKRNVQRTDLDKDAELFMETENFKIYIPLTYEASCKLGSNTEWCTATRETRNYYDNYTSNGHKLYIIINKKDPSEKYQWNDKEEYTCDKYDNEINELDLCIEYTELLDFFEKFGVVARKEVEELKKYEEGEPYIYYNELYNEVECDKNVKNHIINVIMANDVWTIDESAFRGCKKLKSIQFNEGLKEINSNAFENCPSLTSIELPSSLKKIEPYAFSYCTGLKEAVIKSANYLDNNAFLKCTMLSNIKLPSNLTSIGSFAFESCSSLKNIIIPENVDSIGYFAFAFCSSLKSIIIKGNVKTIKHNTFENCSSLNSISIPNTVKSIGNWAFSGCSSLKSIELPNSIEGISDNAFDDTITIRTNNPYVIDYCKKNNIKCEKINSTSDSKYEFSKVNDEENLNGITKNDIFDVHTTGCGGTEEEILKGENLDYYKNKKNIVGEVVMMSPNEYFSICGKEFCINGIIDKEELKNHLSKQTDHLEYLKSVILEKKEKFPIPVLNLSNVNKGQEGYHRLMVAGELFGFDTKFPVLVIKNYDDNIARQDNIKEAQRQFNRAMDWCKNYALKMGTYNLQDFIEQFEIKMEEYGDDYASAKIEMEGNIMKVSYYDKDVDSVLTYTFDTSEVEFEEDTVKDSKHTFSKIADETFRYSPEMKEQMSYWLDEDLGYEYKIVDLKDVIERNGLDDKNHGMFNRNTDEWGNTPEDYKYIPSKDNNPHSPILLFSSLGIKNGNHRVFALYNSGYDKAELLVKKPIK